MKSIQPNWISPIVASTNWLETYSWNSYDFGTEFAVYFFIQQVFIGCPEGTKALPLASWGKQRGTNFYSHLQRVY